MYFAYLFVLYYSIKIINILTIRIYSVINDNILIIVINLYTNNRSNNIINMIQHKIL
ncbi:hypothetical protein [Alphaentomopoxvirus acuprea]|uniref:Uncharacterized protein n=1 Tax=Alphaentomopoxvirus acuprea TaxID=62099 RepID=W6JLA3_9POXV|nr:hypothetical protein BA82_gp046 [Anomala cuprea entomopoxvirus]BAO49406.1 hypothetical protein [Anomala cuprea entomopoxvirus]